MSLSKRTLVKRLFKALVIIPVFIAVQIIILLSGFLLAAYLYFGRDLPTISELERYEPRIAHNLPDPSGGFEAIRFLYREPRVLVDPDHLPPHVVNAFLAAEASRPKSIENCELVIWGYGKTLCLYRHRSPFTRLTANGLLEREPNTTKRRIRGTILAIRLEKTWSNEKILWVFLNQIYLGNGCYGLGEAANHYFGKSAERLSVAEAALIAGLVRSPYHHNPKKTLLKAEERRRFVLNSMLSAGFISLADFENAVTEPVSVVNR